MSVSKNFNPPLRSPYYFIRKGLLQKITQYAPELKGDVLDFGCGSKPYKSLFTNAKTYVGLDYENPGHPHLNEQIDFFYDGKTLPFNANSFNGIFASEVFEHVFNLEEILPQLHTTLKPNGKLLITCPFVWNEHEVPHDYARYTQFALKHLLEKNGFKILVQDKAGDFYTALHQLKMVYFSEQVINSWYVFGKVKFITANLRSILVALKNVWFLIKQPFMPKRYDLYLNNIVLAEKV